MADADPGGRTNQKRRTRKALLEAAARLMQSGRKPTLDEVAEEALVSRATAYRYFPGVEPLLIEAALDIAMPSPALFQGDPCVDAAERALKAEAAVDAMVRGNETALRMMLINALQRSLDGEGGEGLPARQNRRAALIEAALAPSPELDSRDKERLARALALVIGTEARLVFKDVLQLGDDEARDVKAWMIRSLVGAARRRD
ncbi:MAG TPA: helix-turn-helix domain-containing protein [Allosphingosinicella sp.]|nr:helix-turn-helix domain-containing protein [Allosphingosinicella sp.]